MGAAGRAAGSAGRAAGRLGLTVDVQAPGLPRLEAALASAGRRLEVLPGAAELVGAEALKAGRPLVPRLSGLLAATVQHGVTDGGTTATLGSPLIYGFRARRALQAGAQQSSSRWLEIYTQRIQQALEQIEGRY